MAWCCSVSALLLASSLLLLTAPVSVSAAGDGDKPWPQSNPDLKKKLAKLTRLQISLFPSPSPSPPPDGWGCQRDFACAVLGRSTSLQEDRCDVGSDVQLAVVRRLQEAVTSTPRSHGAKSHSEDPSSDETALIHIQDTCPVSDSPPESGGDEHVGNTVPPDQSQSEVEGGEAVEGVDGVEGGEGVDDGVEGAEGVEGATVEVLNSLHSDNPVSHLQPSTLVFFHTSPNNVTMKDTFQSFLYPRHLTSDLSSLLLDPHNASLNVLYVAEEVLVMADIVGWFNWSHVIFLHSEDAFGRRGLELLLTQLETSVRCVAVQTLPLPPADAPEAEFDCLAARMGQEWVRGASAVLVLSQGAQGEGLLKAVWRYVSSHDVTTLSPFHRFVWVGGVAFTLNVTGYDFLRNFLRLDKVNPHLVGSAPFSDTPPPREGSGSTEESHNMSSQSREIASIIDTAFATAREEEGKVCVDRYSCTSLLTNHASGVGLNVSLLRECLLGRLPCPEADLSPPPVDWTLAWREEACRLYFVRQLRRLENGSVEFVTVACWDAVNRLVVLNDTVFQESYDTSKGSDEVLSAEAAEVLSTDEVLNTDEVLSTEEVLSAEEVLSTEEVLSAKAAEVLSTEEVLNAEEVLSTEEVLSAEVLSTEEGRALSAEEVSSTEASAEVLSTDALPSQCTQTAFDDDHTPLPCHECSPHNHTPCSNNTSLLHLSVTPGTRLLLYFLSCSGLLACVLVATAYLWFDHLLRPHDSHLRLLLWLGSLLLYLMAVLFLASPDTYICLLCRLLGMCLCLVLAPLFARALAMFRVAIHLNTYCGPRFVGQLSQLVLSCLLLLVQLVLTSLWVHFDPHSVEYVRGVDGVVGVKCGGDYLLGTVFTFVLNMPLSLYAAMYAYRSTEDLPDDPTEAMFLRSVIGLACSLATFMVTYVASTVLTAVGGEGGDGEGGRGFYQVLPTASFCLVMATLTLAWPSLVACKHVLSKCDHHYRGAGGMEVVEAGGDARREWSVRGGAAPPGAGAANAPHPKSVPVEGQPGARLTSDGKLVRGLTRETLDDGKRLLAFNSTLSIKRLHTLLYQHSDPQVPLYEAEAEKYVDPVTSVDGRELRVQTEPVFYYDEVKAKEYGELEPVYIYPRVTDPVIYSLPKHPYLWEEEEGEGEREEGENPLLSCLEKVSGCCKRLDSCARHKTCSSPTFSPAPPPPPPPSPRSPNAQDPTSGAAYLGKDLFLPHGTRGSDGNFHAGQEKRIKIYGDVKCDCDVVSCPHYQLSLPHAGTGAEASKLVRNGIECSSEEDNDASLRSSEQGSDEVFSITNNHHDQKSPETPSMTSTKTGLEIHAHFLDHTPVPPPPCREGRGMDKGEETHSDSASEACGDSRMDVWGGFSVRRPCSGDDDSDAYADREDSDEEDSDTRSNCDAYHDLFSSPSQREEGEEGGTSSSAESGSDAYPLLSYHSKVADFYTGTLYMYHRMRLNLDSDSEISSDDGFPSSNSEEPLSTSPTHPQRQSPRRGGPQRLSPRQGGLQRLSPRHGDPECVSPRLVAPQRSSPPHRGSRRLSPRRGGPRPLSPRVAPQPAPPQPVVPQPVTPERGCRSKVKSKPKDANKQLDKPVKPAGPVNPPRFTKPKREDSPVNPVPPKRLRICTMRRYSQRERAAMFADPMFTWNGSRPDVHEDGVFYSVPSYTLRPGVAYRGVGGTNSAG